MFLNNAEPMSLNDFVCFLREASKLENCEILLDFGGDIVKKLHRVIYAKESENEHIVIGEKDDIKNSDVI
jgi:hypothetical protein